jgi:hypothetical protein
MKLFRLFLVLALLSAGLVFADSPAKQEEIVIETAPPMESMAGPGPMPHHNFLFISADIEDAGKVVKGAPYSADAITERTQNLADGNRIVNTTNAKVYRDSEGRTRREQQLNEIGNWKASEEPKKLIFIQDPVAKVHYVLEPENQIARKISMDDHAPAPPREGDKVEVFAAPPMPPGGEAHKEVFQYSLPDKDAKTESLGTQTMEGLSVEGSRTTMTIPAGEMGNDLPIKIVSERWYSPDLQTNIMTKHSDPRFGDTVYRLTHISRTEQDHSLFEVPHGYEIEKAPMPPRMIWKQKSKPE